MTHVPAWKRLGLRLKYAKEDPDDLHRPILKRPPERTPPTSPSPKDSRSPSPKVSRGGKRKSVSFTPETKAEDGEGIKQIYKRWIVSSLQEDPDLDPDTLPQALRNTYRGMVENEEHADRDLDPQNDAQSTSLDGNTRNDTESTDLNDASSPDERRAAKRQKRAMRQKPAVSRDDSHLTYLSTYHESPADWKFSKSHQNHLLKHLFSLRHIPPSYDPALLHYLRGLKGGKARQRVRAIALGLRAEDDATAPDYQEALQRLRTGLWHSDQQEPDVHGDGPWAKRRRTEVVLAALEEASGTNPVAEGSDVLREGGDRSFPVENPPIAVESANVDKNGQFPAKKAKRPIPVEKANGSENKLDSAENKGRWSKSFEPEIDGVKGAVQVQVNGETILGRDAAKLNGTMGIAPRKIVFYDPPATAPGGIVRATATGKNSHDQVPPNTSAKVVIKRKQGRKRRSRRTQPDSDSSSSSSSSSESESSEEDRPPSEAQTAQALLRREAAQRLAMSVA